MGKIKKKGTSGQAKNFITRTQAVRKLQVSLPDFRRLCIFKGIYPREPRNKKKASKSSTPSTTFYYTKDIQYLLHEPLLAKFREHKALSKKIARSLGRGELGDAARLEKKNAPRLSLDHIIKERYPTFVDALRDLDDALSLLFLFAHLPATSSVPPKTIALCQRLCLEFQHYLITTHSLRKSFLSIKGIYYQATIQGQDIMWLVPYKFVQRMTGDVDIRIMGTFVEFYTTLLGFVNYRLYTTIGLVYPPRFDERSDEKGAELAAFMLEGKGVKDAEQLPAATNGQTNDLITDNQNGLTEETKRQIEIIAEKDNPEKQPEAEIVDEGEDTSQVIDKFQPITSDADVLLQPESSSDELGDLFAPFTFYLSRETPRQPLEFILRAFGCKRVGWDSVFGPGAFTHNESDPKITHQVVDRPPLTEVSDENNNEDTASSEAANGASTNGQVKPGHRMPGRTYVQPQWVWDCINQVKLLRSDLYAPGAILPPHLSPWMKPTKGTYDPTASLAEQEPEGEAAAAAAEQEEEDELDEEVNEYASPFSEEHEEEEEEEEAVNSTGIHDMDIALADTDSDPDPEDDDKGESNEVPASKKNSTTGPSQHQLELEAEAAGLPPPGTTKQLKSILKKPPLSTSTSATLLNDKVDDEDEETERRKMLLSRKKRKMYEKMTYGNKMREEEAKGLRAKRRRIESEREAKADGKR